MHNFESYLRKYLTLQHNELRHESTTMTFKLFLLQQRVIDLVHDGPEVKGLTEAKDDTDGEGN